MEVTGEPILKLIGRMREIVAAGPNPGSTPTIVPNKAPIKAKRRFTGLKAMPNPEIKP